MTVIIVRNETELIELAIDKLTTQRDAALDGEWILKWRDQEMFIGNAEAKKGTWGIEEYVAEWTYAINRGDSQEMKECEDGNYDAHLILTLHRTIGVQLELLNLGLTSENDTITKLAVDLATTILK